MYVFTSPEVVSLPETVQLLHDPEELQPLTSDRASLRAAVDSLTAQAEPPAIALAVTVGRKIGAVDDRLKPGRQTPQIVLVTDGSSTEAVREAERAGVGKSSASRHNGQQLRDYVFQRAAKQGRSDRVRSLR